MDNDVKEFETVGISVTCDLEKSDCASYDAVGKYWLYSEVLYNFKYGEKFDESGNSDFEVFAVCNTDCIEIFREVDDDEFI